MSAAVLTPPNPHMMGGSVGVVDNNNNDDMLSFKSPDEYRRQLMMAYAFSEYRYVISEEDADEIFYEPGWWEDVDDFVRYMQQVNFGTPIPGTTNVALPSSLRVYTTAELDAMETGDLDYPPCHPECVSWCCDYDYGESLSLPPTPPTYGDAVDALFAALGQELEELGLVDHDHDHDHDHHAKQQQPPPQPEVVDVEPEDDEQLDDDLSSLGLGSLTVPPDTPTSGAADDDDDDASVAVMDIEQPPEMIQLAEATTIEVAIPAVVEVVKTKKEQETTVPLPTAPTTTTTTRRERFDLQVRQAKGKLSRGLEAISSPKGLLRKARGKLMAVDTSRLCGGTRA